MLRAVAGNVGGGGLTSVDYADLPVPSSDGESYLLSGLDGVIVVSRDGAWHGSGVITAIGAGVGIAGSGNMADNGVLTPSTPVGRFFKAYLYLPAGAISSGSAAGFYWAEVNNTIITFYNNTYVPGVDSLHPPPSETPFVTTGPGAFVQTTSEIDVYDRTIPGGMIGDLFNQLSFEVYHGGGADANTKTLRLYLGTDVINTNNATSSFLRFDAAAFLSRTTTMQMARTPYGSSYLFNGVAATSSDPASDISFTLTLQLVNNQSTAVVLAAAMKGA